MLHILNKPFAHSVTTECLQVVQRGDTLLLIEDGVLAAIAGSELIREMESREIVVCAVEADVVARGLCNRLHPTVRVIDYTGFVDLCCLASPIQSWY